jgi:hypothetical protein
MARDVRLVTVRGGGHRVDLSLPAAVPIVELIPAVATLCRLDAPAGEATPPAWTVARAGEAPLGLGASLAEAGVADGEVLYLVDAADWQAPAVLRTREAIAETVRTGTRWDVATRTAVLAGLAGAQLLASAAIWIAAAGGARLVGLAGLLAGVALRAVAATGAARRSAATRLTPIAGGIMFTGLGGWGLAGGGAAASSIAAGGVAAAIAAVAAYGVVPWLAPAVAAAAAALALGAGIVTLGAGPVQAAAVLALLAVTALRLLPSLVGRLGARDAARGPEEAARAARRARRLLASLSAGTVLAAAGAVTVLAAAADPVAAALAAVAALGLLLQVPVYRFVREALPLALGAAVGLLALEAAAAVRLLVPTGQGTAAVVLLAGGGIAAAGVSLLSRPLTGAARWASWTWPLVDASMVPLVLAQVGALAALARLVQAVAG